MSFWTASPVYAAPFPETPPLRSLATGTGVLYQNPVDKKRYEVRDPITGLIQFKKMAVPITQEILDRIPTATGTDAGDMKTRDAHAGQILFSSSDPMRVWYVSLVDLKRYYFDGTEQSMAFLGDLEHDRPEKNIRISLSKQRLEQRVGDEVLASYPVSSGRKGMATPTGTFSILSKRKRAWSSTSRLWMPWWMAFTKNGNGIHELPESPGGIKEGANHLGKPVSHGCVRLGVGPAEYLYRWAPQGTTVVVVP